MKVVTRLLLLFAITFPAAQADDEAIWAYGRSPAVYPSRESALGMVKAWSSDEAT
jgi:hypothetical protein